MIFALKRAGQLSLKNAPFSNCWMISLWCCLIRSSITRLVGKLKTSSKGLFRWRLNMLAWVFHRLYSVLHPAFRQEVYNVKSCCLVEMETPVLSVVKKAFPLCNEQSLDWFFSSQHISLFPCFALMILAWIRGFWTSNLKKKNSFSTCRADVLL